MAASPDIAKLATVSAKSKTVTSCDLPALTTRGVIDDCSNGTYFGQVEFSPDSTLLVSVKHKDGYEDDNDSSSNGTVGLKLWNVDSLTCILSLEGVSYVTYMKFCDSIVR
jgi:hypothetical protein